MSNLLHVPLQASPEQRARLHALQVTFAEVCNVLAPVARDTRCWNRVALHHMMYRTLRERFPQLGSQMVCNAIYSVSRTCRRVYQSPASPFNLVRLGERPLPLLRFAPHSPVYFDRHTLSIKNGRLSIFTLDGRMRFAIQLPPAVEQRFREERLLETALSSRQDVYKLTFVFEAASGVANAPDEDNPLAVGASVVVPDAPAVGADGTRAGELPDYVLALHESITTGTPA